MHVAESGAGAVRDHERRATAPGARAGLRPRPRAGPLPAPRRLDPQLAPSSSGRVTIRCANFSVLHWSFLHT